MNRSIISLLIFFLLCGCAIGPTGPTDTEEKPSAQLPGVTFYPPLPDEPRLQFLYSITTEDDVSRPEQSAVDQFLFGDKQSEKFISRPWDIGSSKGKIYLVDAFIQKLICIDLAKKKFEMIEGSGRGSLQNPVGIWVTEDDVKYVADRNRKQVVVLAKDNKFIRAYGNKDLFKRPLDVAVYGNSVYVIDMEKNLLFVLDKETGRHVNTIGEPGHGEGQFWKPTHVLVDRSGNIFVNDAFNFRIQKFDPEGNFLKSYGSLGDAPGNLARPKGVGVSEDGHMYVADVAFSNIQIFDEKSGQLLLILEGPGPGALAYPSAVHLDYENMDYFKEFVNKDFQVKYLLYVGDFLTQHRVKVFGFGQWIGPALSGEPAVSDEPALSGEPALPDE
jgi:hypothetical protein